MMAYHSFYISFKMNFRMYTSCYCSSKISKIPYRVFSNILISDQIYDKVCSFEYEAKETQLTEF